MFYVIIDFKNALPKRARHEYCATKNKKQLSTD